jgi:metal-responsive CopG/Arc/MetJ family transcriptional regulator
MLAWKNGGRGNMPGKTKKATFSLRTDILEELDDVMSKGMAPSKNALVEQALLKELKELRRQERQRVWQEGAKDTLLLKDIKDVETAFRNADAETEQRIS